MENPTSTYLKETKTLALFDFDGTVTTKDTLKLFIVFTHGTFKFYLGCLVLSPILLGYMLKLYPNAVAKQKLLSWFYKGWNYAAFKRKGEEFCSQVLPGYIRQSAIKKIRWHQKKQHRVILVSASIEEWLEPWCHAMEIELICTRMEVKDNLVTGRFSTPNCYGPEKAARLKAFLKMGDYDTIYAYGDSSGDKDMLALATKPYYQHFDE